MDKKLYIQLQYPDDPCVGPVDSPRMDTLLSDILKVRAYYNNVPMVCACEWVLALTTYSLAFVAFAQSVADYEVTLQAGLSPCSCCGHRKTGQPQGLSGARQWSESWAFSVR